MVDADLRLTRASNPSLVGGQKYLSGKAANITLAYKMPRILAPDLLSRAYFESNLPKNAILFTSIRL